MEIYTKSAIKNCILSISWNRLTQICAAHNISERELYHAAQDNQENYTDYQNAMIICGEIEPHSDWNYISTKELKSVFLDISSKDFSKKESALLDLLYTDNNNLSMDIYKKLLQLYEKYGDDALCIE